MLKFTIILPVYNVEKFLPDCLDSLYAQDIPETDYEIICVIDGSPDNSAQVVRSYQKKHSNIKLIEQPNSGVCIARNRGFEDAAGKYVWFIDPDDMIAANCLGKIYQMMEARQADIFEFDYATCEEEKKYEPFTVDFQIEGENREGSSGSGCLSVCRSGYLRQHHIEYNPKLHYGEDYLWALQTKYRRHKSIYTHAQLYIYRQRNNSAMHIVSYEKTEKHLQDMLTLHDCYGLEYDRCCQENLPKSMLINIKRRRQLCLETALVHLMKLKLSHRDLKKRLEELRQEGYYPYHLMFWNLGFKSVLGALASRWGKFLFPLEPYYLLVCAIYRKKAK